jgi:hypothetical protein
VTGVRREPLAAIEEGIARREGFPDRRAFFDYRRSLHGGVDPEQEV